MKRHLRTAEQYRNAPVGTAVAAPGRPQWVKITPHGWAAAGIPIPTTYAGYALGQRYASGIVRREVIRWGVEAE